MRRARHVGVAGVEDDGDLRVAERAQQTEAVHARHVHVAHDDTDGSLVEDAQRFRAVRGLEDVRFETFEGARDAPADLGDVVDDEDALHAISFERRASA